MLQHLVTRAGGDLTARAGDGMAPLHAAAQMGCLDCIKWMVKVEQIFIVKLRIFRNRIKCDVPKILLEIVFLKRTIIILN